MKSASSASSVPPPRAKPCTAAIIGWGKLRIFLNIPRNKAR